VIENGVLAGRSIADAIAMWGRNLLGEAALSPRGGFPLLVKFLDARENLSVQVHPSIAYCKAHPDAHLKTECWYIMHAEPGAKIYKGLRPGVTREQFEAALRTGQGAGVVQCLEAVDAVKGECHNLPSGTVHALGAGVLVAEVQTPSDTTFRVYDWGRTGRELHVEQSLQCITFDVARDATRAEAGTPISRLVTTGYFEVDEMRLPAGVMTTCADGVMGSLERPQVLMVLEGTVQLGTEVLKQGQTALVPARIVKLAALEAMSNAVVLRTVVRG
jgi:mannose-6-phosphate isomerase